MQEKRRHPRRPVRIPVRILPREAAPFDGETVDLSVGGMFIESQGSVAFGQELEIELDLPGLGPTRLPAIVRWNRPEGFGVQLGLLGARHTHALANLIDGTARE
jgi:type IV pilus assembly protein PilZ